MKKIVLATIFALSFTSLNAGIPTVEEVRDAYINRKANPAPKLKVFAESGYQFEDENVFKTMKLEYDSTKAEPENGAYYFWVIQDDETLGGLVAMP